MGPTIAPVVEAGPLTLTPAPRLTIAGAVAPTSCSESLQLAAFDLAGASLRPGTGRTAGAAFQTALALVHPLVEGAGTPAVLAAVAREACVHAGASAGALFSTNGDAVRLAAAHDLDDGFAAALSTRLRDEAATPDVSGRGVLEIAQLARDERFARAWSPCVQRLAGEAGYVAMVSFPLIASGAPLATLDLYSDRGGDWLGDRRRALMDFIRVAAGAIEISLARDEQHARMQALDGLVTALRYEAHEYANRLHVLSSLLWLEDTDAARRFLDELTELHRTGPVADLSRIANPVVAGVLAGHMSAARAKGVTLVLDERSRLDALPVGLSDACAVTLFANLLDNALDAAAEMSGLRRRVQVALEQHRDGITVEVRDWGRGLHDAAPSALAVPGRTTKPDHYGLGLSLVRGVVDAAGGSFELEQLRNGAVARVWLPLRSPSW